MDGNRSIDGTTGVRYARGCHPNDLWTKYFTSSSVVKDYREKYGEPDVVEVRQTFNDSLQAREWEEKVLKRLKVTNNDKWLNLHIGKSPPSRFQSKHTDESKEKMRVAKLGVPRSKEACQKVSDGQKGRIVALSTRNKISSRLKGHSVSPETRLKIGQIHKDKPLSEEHRQKISIALTGRPRPEEVKNKISKTKKLKIVSNLT